MASPQANIKDVESIDALLKTFYGVISGPAGKRDWNRFHSLFSPTAQMGAVPQATKETDSGFFSFTPLQYQQNNTPLFEKSAFYEEEVGRTQSLFGNLASVQSGYQFKMEEKGKIIGNGVNYISLVKANGRWWITSLSWQQTDKMTLMPVSLKSKKK